MAEPRTAVGAAGRRLLRRGARGVRQTLSRRTGLLAYLAILGPGMIAANAGNDAGGIATFASVGADLGYRLLWILIPITIALGIVQEMCARMGAVTGKGLADLIRERFGVRWTAFVMLALLIANGGVTVSEFVGIAAAMELFGVARYISVPIAAIAIWWLVVKGSYQRVERVFLAMTLVFLSYVVSAFLAHPPWGTVVREVVHPHFEFGSAYLFTCVAIIGGLPLIRVLIITQVINGLLLPVILVAVLRLVNNRELMGSHVNGPLYNLAAWLTTFVVSGLSVLLITATLFPNLFAK